MYHSKFGEVLSKYFVKLPSLLLLDKARKKAFI